MMMADTSSNSIWVNADNYSDWELSRPQIFREEARDLFFTYFRIKPSDLVLDGGCGSGVLTRFIAKGLQEGKITGFDISKSFVDFGNHRVHEEDLADRAKIVLEDGYHLSFKDNTFDSVVNHTYLGVLSDPVAGLKELIRVCKVGGNVSASVSTRNLKVTWQGDYPIDGMDRITDLMEKYERVYRKVMTPILKQNAYWHANRYPKLFSECGLNNISINPIASTFAYDDPYWSEEYSIQKITTEMDHEIEIYEEHKGNPLFAEYGFSKEEFDELIGLLRQKQDYLLKNFRLDTSWEWTASLHFIVTGTKTGTTV
jgi:ubiquinone/menaquinone biosynthesis C-methylase UbiE